MPYIGKGANGFGIRERYRYSASGSQTAFTGSDLDSKTLNFDSGSLLDVYLNGVLLDTADYNTSTANTVTLTSGATASDEVMIVVYDVFSLSDAMPKTGGTFSGGITGTTGTFTGDITVDTTTLKVDSSNNRVGVGTASPDTELHVKGATTVANFEGTGGSSFIGLKDSDDGTVGFIGVDGGSIKFQTSGGSYSDKLVIDADGIITKPLQPMFEVTKGSEQTLSSGSLTLLTFDTEVYDLNSDFDLSNDRFIAPVAGKYVFQAYITTGTMVAGAGIGLVWQKTTSGGSESIFKHGHSQSTEINITFGLSSTLVVDLGSGEGIRLYGYHGSGSNQSFGAANNQFSGTNANSNYWSGQLIG
tara:strand:- start:67 stop:1143 length:1077 start_codon:yes stop_codon:yes gene_type:complete